MWRKGFSPLRSYRSTSPKCDIKLSMRLELTCRIWGKKFIIELDGSQHLEQEQYDAERTQYLESQGYHVIRFWNNQVEKEINNITQILNALLNQDECDGNKLEIQK